MIDAILEFLSEGRVGFLPEGELVLPGIVVFDALLFFL